MPRPLLSVVVATHERRAELAVCLEALAALEDPVEVVVVDSASRVPSGRIAERFVDRIPGLRYVYEESSRPLARTQPRHRRDVV